MTNNEHDGRRDMTEPAPRRTPVHHDNSNATERLHHTARRMQPAVVEP